MGEQPFAGGLRSEAVSDQLVWFERHDDCLTQKRKNIFYFTCSTRLTSVVLVFLFFFGNPI
jgi:hypothetical protein